jgi:hypothetical protein
LEVLSETIHLSTEKPFNIYQRIGYIFFSL